MTGQPDAETLDRMRRALARLRPIQHEIFLMSAADGLSYREIGERLGISVAMVERHLADALFNLDRLVERGARPWWRFW